MRRCCACAADSVENNYLVACASEYYRQYAGNSDSAWQKADVWVADMPVCRRCILAICTRYLRTELRSSQGSLIQSLSALIAVVLFVLVADTGAFKGLGSMSLFIAVFVTGVFLYGLFGLPYYSYRAIKLYAQRSRSLGGNLLSGEALYAAIQLEASRLIAAGGLRTVQGEGKASASSLPDGHPHRETVLAVATNYGTLAEKAPEQWRSWVQRRMPNAVSD
jgi:hypothetical protein